MPARHSAALSISVHKKKQQKEQNKEIMQKRSFSPFFSLLTFSVSSWYAGVFAFCFCCFIFFFFCLLLFLLSLSFSLFHSTSFPPLSLLISVFNFLFCFKQTVDTARQCRQFFHFCPSLRVLFNCWKR